MCVPLEVFLLPPYADFVMAGGILDLGGIGPDRSGVVTPFDQKRKPHDEQTSENRKSFLADFRPTDQEAARKFVDGFDLHADCRKQ